MNKKIQLFYKNIKIFTFKNKVQTFNSILIVNKSLNNQEYQDKTVLKKKLNIQKIKYLIKYRILNFIEQHSNHNFIKY